MMSSQKIWIMYLRKKKKQVDVERKSYVWSKETEWKFDQKTDINRNDLNPRHNWKAYDQYLLNKSL